MATTTTIPHTIHKSTCPDVLKRKAEVIEESQYTGNPDDVMLIFVDLFGEINEMLLGTKIGGHTFKITPDIIKRMIQTKTGMICSCCTKDIRITCEDVFDGMTVFVTALQDHDGKWESKQIWKTDTQPTKDE